MSDLAPFVLAFMRDEALNRLLEENRKLRSLIRHVTVQLVGPNDEVDPDVKDHEGLHIFFKRRVDLLADSNDEALVDISTKGLYQVEPRVLMQMRLRFGDLYEAPVLGDCQVCMFITDAVFNRQNQGCLYFTLEIGDSEDEKFSIYGSVGGVGYEYSVEKYSILSGLSMDSILSKMTYNKKGLGSIEELAPFPVDLDVLEEMYPHRNEFHFEVFGAKVPLQYIKKKCHFL